MVISVLVLEDISVIFHLSFGFHFYFKYESEIIVKPKLGDKTLDKGIAHCV